MIINNENEIYDDYRICPKCGAKILSKNHFCTKCGNRLDVNYDDGTYITNTNADAIENNTEINIDDKQPHVAKENNDDPVVNNMTRNFDTGIPTPDTNSEDYNNRMQNAINDINSVDDFKSIGDANHREKSIKPYIIAIAVLAILLIAAIGESIYLYSTVQHLHKSFDGMQAMRDDAIEEKNKLQAKYADYDNIKEELEDVKDELQESQKQAAKLQESRSNEFDELFVRVESDVFDKLDETMTKKDVKKIFGTPDYNYAEMSDAELKKNFVDPDNAVANAMTFSSIIESDLCPWVWVYFDGNNVSYVNVTWTAINNSEEEKIKEAKEELMRYMKENYPDVYFSEDNSGGFEFINWDNGISIITDDNNGGLTFEKWY